MKEAPITRTVLHCGGVSKGGWVAVESLRGRRGVCVQFLRKRGYEKIRI